MPTFTCTINLDNAAFVDDHAELERILTLIGKTAIIDQWGPVPGTRRIHDANGNTVGTWTITE